MEHILSLKNYEVICGVCLKNAECLIDINSKVSLGTSLYDMIHYMMKIKIKNFDNHSVKVCSECMPEILTAYNLFRKLRNSTVALEPFVGFGGQTCGEKQIGEDEQILDEISLLEDEVMNDVQVVEVMSDADEDVKDFTIGEERIMFLDPDTSNVQPQPKLEDKNSDKRKQLESTRVFCCYCNSFQESQFIRHLEHFHKDESDVFEFFASKMFSKKRMMLLKRIKERGEIEYQANKSLYDDDVTSTPSTSRQADSGIKTVAEGFCKFCKTEHTDLALHLTMHHRHERQVGEFLMFSRSTAMSRQLLEVLQKEGLKYRNLVKVFCIFCKNVYVNGWYLSHVEKAHSDIPEVKRYLELPKNSKQREDLCELWRHKGMAKYKAIVANGKKKKNHVQNK